MWIPTERATEGMKDTDKPRDEGSGADGSRKEFLRLMEEVKKGHIHVVVTRDGS